MSSDAEDNIRVYLRVRPASEREKENGGARQCLDLAGAKENTVTILSKPNPHSFTFDHVAPPSSTQEQVFQRVGAPLTDAVLAGYNSTVFAYGQTGSGKTFTIQGPADEERPELLGLMPRVFDYLCGQMSREERRSNGALSFSATCSFLEIYNDQVYDLLDPAATSLSLHEDRVRGAFVRGLTSSPVASAADAHDVMRRGMANRTVGETAMNRESSRSHSVFTIDVRATETTADGARAVRHSRFNLIDLAGSERQKATQAAGARLKEASRINRSLAALGNVIRALADVAKGRERHVHYRDSKLTFLLKDSLGGNSLTYVVACVSPDQGSYGETYSTLRFADKAKSIRNRAVVNQDSTASVAALRAENQRLRDAVARMKAGGGEAALTTPLRSGRAPSSFFSPSSSSSSGGRELRRMLQDSLDRERAVRAARDDLERRAAALESLAERQELSVRNLGVMVEMRERLVQALRDGGGGGDAAALDEALAGMARERKLWRAAAAEAAARKELEIGDARARLEELEAALPEGGLDERLRRRLDHEQQRAFEMAARVARLQAQHERLEGEVGDMRERQSSPSKLLPSLATPLRKRWEGFSSARADTLQRELREGQARLAAAEEARSRSALEATRAGRRLEEAQRALAEATARAELGQRELRRERVQHEAAIEQRAADEERRHAEARENSRAVVESLKAELEAAKTARADTASAADNASAEVADLRSRVARTEAELREARADARRAADELADTQRRLRAQVESLERQAAERAAETEAARAEAARGVEGLREAAAERDAARASAEAEAARADEAERKAAEVEQVRGELGEARAEARRLEEAAGAERAEAVTLRGRLESAEAELSNARASAEMAQDDQEETLTMLETAEHVCEELRGSLREAAAEAEQARARAAEAEAAAADAEERFEAARREAREAASAGASAEAAALADERDKYEADAREARAEAVRLRAAVDAAGEELRAAGEEARAARAERDRAAAASAAVSAAYQQMREEYAAAAAELQRLRAEAVDTAERADRADRAAADAADRANELEERAEAAELRLAETETEARAEAERLGAEVRRCDAARQEAHDRARDLEERLAEAEEARRADAALHAEAERRAEADAEKAATAVREAEARAEQRVAALEAAHREAMAGARARLGADQQVADAEAARLREEVASLAAEVEAQRGRADKWRLEAVEAGRQLAAETAAAREEAAASRAEAEASGAALAVAEEAAGELRGTVERLRARLAEAVERADAAEEEGREAAEARDEAESRLAGAAERAERFRREAATANETARGAVDALGAVKAEEEEAHAAMMRARSEAKELGERLAMVRAERDGLERRTEELGGEVAKLVGHQNSRQKIRHHQKLKQEYDEMQVRNRELERAQRGYKRLFVKHGIKVPENDSIIEQMAREDMAERQHAEAQVHGTRELVAGILRHAADFFGEAGGENAGDGNAADGGGGGGGGGENDDGSKAAASAHEAQRAMDAFGRMRDEAERLREQSEAMARELKLARRAEAEARAVAEVERSERGFRAAVVEE